MKSNNELLNLANSAFINEIDIVVEKSTRNNIKRISELNSKQIHSKLLSVLKITSTDVSKYFDYNTFAKFVNVVQNERKKRAEAAKKGAAKKENVAGNAFDLFPAEQKAQ